MPRTVLLMTYEFPPSGGGGVQRMAKLARYLPDFDWTPVVVTGEPVKGRPTDPVLAAEVSETEVARTPSRHVSSVVARAISPLKALRRASAGRGAASGGSTRTAVATASPTVSARVARHITMDDAQFWVGPAVRAAVALGKKRAVEAVIATGPPFSVTVAGMRAAAELGVPLIVDMRDPWRGSPVAWFPNEAARQRSIDAQRRVMSAAAAVVATTPTIAEEASELGAKQAVHIPNGYDANDIVEWRPQADTTLRLSFMGKMFRGHSEPWDLIAALAKIREERDDLRVEFDIIGEPLDDVRAAVEAAGIADRVSFAGYLPHHDALERLATADVAIGLIADRPGAKAAIGGKIFEYLGMRIPTLVLGPVDGESARLVTGVGGGWAVSPHDVDAIVDLLVRLAEGKRDGHPVPSPDSDVVARYERHAIAGEFAALLAEVTRR